jgi:hypothetical protein
MNERLLVFLSLSIAATGLLLLQSYKEYTHAAEQYFRRIDNLPVPA